MRVNKDGSGKTNIGPTGFRQLADIRVHKYGYGMPGLNFLDAKLVHHIKIKLNRMQITSIFFILEIWSFNILNKILELGYSNIH